MSKIRAHLVQSDSLVHQAFTVFVLERIESCTRLMMRRTLLRLPSSLTGVSLIEDYDASDSDAQPVKVTKQPGLWPCCRWPIGNDRQFFRGKDPNLHVYRMMVRVG